MKRIKNIFAFIGDALALILLMLFGIAMSFIMTGGEMLFLFIVCLFNYLTKIDMIDNLISLMNDYMVYSVIILTSINFVICTISAIVNDFDFSEKSSSTESYAQSSSKEFSFNEYCDYEFRKIREREHLEELKKINSKLS